MKEDEVGERSGTMATVRDNKMSRACRRRLTPLSSPPPSLVQVRLRDSKADRMLHGEIAAGSTSFDAIVFALVVPDRSFRDPGHELSNVSSV